MQHEPQSNVTTKGETKSIRIREDVWEAARTKAFQRKTNIVRVIDEALRQHFGLEGETASAA